MKTVYVTAGETTLIEWKNIPITAQIQITKKSADYNPTNGLPAGALPHRSLCPWTAPPSGR